VSAAQFALQLDFSIVNVALATIQREFGVSAANLQWLVTGYALPFGALLLLGGRIWLGRGRPGRRLPAVLLDRGRRRRLRPRRRPVLPARSSPLRGEQPPS
jgi:MFS family permease